MAQEIYYARLFQIENKRPLTDNAGLYQYYHAELQAFIDLRRSSVHS